MNSNFFRAFFLMCLAAGGSYLMVKHIENQNTSIPNYIPNYIPISGTTETECPVQDSCLVENRSSCSLREIYPTDRTHLMTGSIIYHMVLDCHNNTYTWETVIAL